MQKIPNLKHPKSTYIYGISVMFERAGYYGVRALLVLYLTSSLLSEGGLELPVGEALNIYGTLASAIILTKILGALLGDLLLKHKKVILAGVLLQALGAFLLCIHSTQIIYVSIGLMALGSGFYSPNVTACFGKNYLEKTKLLDSAFSIYYVFINLGAFLGTLILGYLGEVYSWKISFILAGLLFLLSGLIIFFLKEETVTVEPQKTVYSNNGTKYILLTILVLSVFWIFIDMAHLYKTEALRNIGEVLGYGGSYIIFQQIESFPVIILTIIFAVIWSWYYSHQIVKILIGFVFGALSLGMLFLIPEVVAAEHFWIFCVSILFFGIAEVHLAPILNATIIKYANPKYIAITIALSIVCMQLFAKIAILIPDSLYNNPMSAFNIGFVGILLATLLIALGISFGKKYLKE